MLKDLKLPTTNTTPTFFWVLLAIILGIGLCLRLIGQPDIPYGFHRDEAAIGYSAYSITQTLRDEWGTWLPLHFRMLGDYPPGIYNYAVALVMLFMGPTELAERLPAIIAGTALVLLQFGLARRLGHSPSVALMVAALTAVTPWFLGQSRAGSEVMLALALAYSAWLLWFRNSITNQAYSKKTHQSVAFTVVMGFTSLFLLLAAQFTYNAAKLLIPVISLIWCGYWWPLQQRWQRLATILGISLLFVVGGGSVFFSKEASISFRSLSLFNQTGNFQAETDREAQFGVPLMVSRVLHNKPTALAVSFIGQYLDYLAPFYLLFHGGFPERYRVPEYGAVYLWMVPFLIWGFIALWRRQLKAASFWLIWLLLSPIMGALTTTDTPHVKRAFTLFLPLITYTAAGIVDLCNAIRNYWQKTHAGTTGFSGSAQRGIMILGVTCCLIVVGWETIRYGVASSVHTAFTTVNERSYGWKEVFSYLREITATPSTPNQTNQPNAATAPSNQIVIFENNDAPHIFYLFYNRYSPARFQQIAATASTNIFDTHKKRWHIDQYTFDPGSCPDVIEPTTVYVSLAERCNNLLPTIDILHTVYNPDKLAKFIIYRAKSTNSSPQ